MHGWRAKIGIMIPSINTVMESEMWQMAPPGLSVHTSRMHFLTTNAEELKEMANQTERCAKELGTAECDVVVYGCTSGSFVHGLVWEESLKEKIADTAKCKAVTASGALKKAIECFGVKRLSIATPYINELVELEDRFFESLGYEVVSAAGLGHDNALVIEKVSPEFNYAYAKSIVKDETDLLIISCTDFRSIEIIKKLEDDLGIPVLSSNQACMWASMRAAGLKDKLLEYGSLFNY